MLWRTITSESKADEGLGFFEHLGNQQNRTQFHCGVPLFNDYLAKYVKQDVKLKASVVFVLIDRAEPERVIGFYTLCATSVAIAELPEEVTRTLRVIRRFMRS